MKSEKRHMTEGMELPNQEKEETYKYLGILEADTSKQMEMKEKIKKRESQENEKATRKLTK